MVPGELATESRVVDAPVADGAVPAAPDLDLAKAASVERHGGPARSAWASCRVSA
jgi:adenine deaminase